MIGKLNKSNTELWLVVWNKILCSDWLILLQDNQLHRYSRVLQSNIGNVFTVKSPPTCPTRVPLPHNPLNSSQPTNLAGSQKLLSVGGDIDFPVIPGHLGDWSDGVEIDWLGSSDLTSSGSGIMSWAMFYIFCTVCVFCYVIYRLCHNQYNCRYNSLNVQYFMRPNIAFVRLRRRQNTLARLISAVDF